MNNKGNIIVTIVLLLLIGAIIYFSYANQVPTKNDVKNSISTAKNSISSGLTDKLTKNDEKTKDNLVPKQDFNSFVKFNAEINTKSFNINTNQLTIKGLVKGTCGDKKLELKNPTFYDFKGFLDLNKKTISGNAKKITIDDSILWLDCDLKLNNYKEIDINSMTGSFEENNVYFKIKTDNIDKEFKKAYVKIKDYYVKATITNNIILDGNARLINVIADGMDLKIQK